MREWIERLDRGGDGGAGLQFYVYHLQNTPRRALGAAAAAGVHGPRDAAGDAVQAPTLAPGTPAGQIVNPPTFQPQPHAADRAAAPPCGQPPPSTRSRPAAPGAGPGTGIVRNLQVVADKDANTLLVIATPAEYTVIEQALRKLDIPQRQVIIEVTIAEVIAHRRSPVRRRLAVQGRRAIQAGGFGRHSCTGDLFGAHHSASPPPPRAPTLGRRASPRASRYIINNANFPGGIQAVLRLLDTYGNTKVVANPHVAALDNQKATIKAGNRIPINQQTLVGGDRPTP